MKTPARAILVMTVALASATTASQLAGRILLIFEQLIQQLRQISANCHSGLEPESRAFSLDSRFRGNDNVHLVISSITNNAARDMRFVRYILQEANSNPVEYVQKRSGKAIPPIRGLADGLLPRTVRRGRHAPATVRDVDFAAVFCNTDDDEKPPFPAGWGLYVFGQACWAGGHPFSAKPKGMGVPRFILLGVLSINGLDTTMGLFYSLGKAAGPKIRKGKWIWQSLTGSEADTVAAENAAGADLASEVARQVSLVSDGATQNLISDIGLRLAACVKNKHRSFHFAAVESAEPNAFALPGGFIYVTGGLLELCRCTPDEIAFVLAHEMAHVIRGHPMQRIVSDSAVTTLSRAAPLRGALGVWLKRVGIQFLQSAYSQDRELEADRLGIRLLKAAHFKSDAAADLFRRLIEIDRRGQLAELSSYFSSHPQLPDRIRAVTAAAKKQKRQ